jgi:hypothetical protein
MKMDRYRFVLGAVIVLGLMILASFIALGKVEEKSSFGLTAIMAILAKVALDFSEWAFRPKHIDDGKDKEGEGLK